MVEINHIEFQAYNSESSGTRMWRQVQEEVQITAIVVQTNRAKGSEYSGDTSFGFPLFLSLTFGRSMEMGRN